MNELDVFRRCWLVRRSRTCCVTKSLEMGSVVRPSPHHWAQVSASCSGTSSKAKGRPHRRHRFQGCGLEWFGDFVFLGVPFCRCSLVAFLRALVASMASAASALRANSLAYLCQESKSSALGSLSSALSGMHCIARQVCWATSWSSLCSVSVLVSRSAQCVQLFVPGGVCCLLCGRGIG